MSRRALVTGAAGGIGQAIVQRLRADGWEVVAVDRRTPDAPQGQDGVHWLRCDLADDAAIAALAREAGIGTLHALVHGAAIIDSASWDAIAPDEAAAILRINAVAPVLLTRALESRLADGASVLLFGSVGAVRASPATTFYAASKAAIVNLAATLSQVLAPRGIRVNVLAPGLIDTRLTVELNDRLARERGQTPAAVAHDRAAAVPLGRAGTAAEVADACAFLLGPQSVYFSGSTLYMTGGAMAGAI